MTLPKQEIEERRRNGQSYLQIATDLGLSINTVKSHCRRKQIKVQTQDKEELTVTSCKHCGSPLTQATKGKPKKFCTENCRRTWWKENNEQLAKKAYYTSTCLECNKEFASYGNQNRKFCEHACYIENRFKKGRRSDDSSTV